jgi:hypothetical protein
MTPCCEPALFLHKCFFDFRVSFFCDGWQIQERLCIKFCVKLCNSITETLEMLREAFGEHSLHQTAVFEWYSCFKASQVSAEGDKLSGRPSTSNMTKNVEKIRELIHEDRCRIIRELADTVEISYGVCQI